jgi:hypothetical protein
MSGNIKGKKKKNVVDGQSIAHNMGDNEEHNDMSAKQHEKKRTDYDPSTESEIPWGNSRRIHVVWDISKK